MLNDDEIVNSVQAESDPVDDETDEEENNNNEKGRDSRHANDILMSKNERRYSFGLRDKESENGAPLITRVELSDCSGLGLKPIPLMVKMILNMCQPLARKQSSGSHNSSFVHFCLALQQETPWNLPLGGREHHCMGLFMIVPILMMFQHTCFDTDHLIGTSAHAPQSPMVSYIGIGTVGPGPHALLRR
ncbi:hypothetical protein TNCV_4653731 [Trichonephila clavipes]|nr:hypothetical protein TNCV_4653731 [Trichonephila clavipes]